MRSPALCALHARSCINLCVDTPFINMSAAATFTTKAALQDALQLVACDGGGEQYGPPNTWDVSEVTDMSELVYGLPCRTTFNEVRAVLAVVCPTVHGTRPVKPQRFGLL